MIPTVYLLHFAAPLGNPQNPRALASHYLGWAVNLEARIAQHRAGRGSHITRAAVERGIAFDVVATWPGDWLLERRLKALKATPRLCPICGCRHRGGRLHVSVSWHQLELPLDSDELTAPAVNWPRWDWVEIRHYRTLIGYTGDNLAEQDTSNCDIPY